MPLGIFDDDEVESVIVVMKEKMKRKEHAFEFILMVIFYESVE
jgi:hypothetical protein